MGLKENQRDTLLGGGGGETNHMAVSQRGSHLRGTAGFLPMSYSPVEIG